MIFNPEFIATTRVSDAIIHFKDGDRLIASLKHGFMSNYDRGTYTKRSPVNLYPDELALWKAISEKNPDILKKEPVTFYSQLKLVRAKMLLTDPAWLDHYSKKFADKCTSMYAIVMKALKATDQMKSKVVPTFETSQVFSRSLIKRKVKLPCFNEPVVLRIYIQASPFELGKYQLDIRIQPHGKEKSYEQVFALATLAQTAHEAIVADGVQLGNVLLGTEFI